MTDRDDTGRGDQRGLSLVQGEGGRMMVHQPFLHGHHNDDDDSIDPRDLLRILKKRRWIILSVIVIFAVTAALSAVLTVPVYRSTAVVEINHESARILRIQDFLPDAGSAQAAEQFYTTQYEILRGRALSEAVVRQEGVESHPELTGEIRQRSLMGEVTSVIRVLRGAFSAPPTATAREVDPDLVREAAIRRAGAVLRSKIQVTPHRGSRLVSVSVSSFDRQFAARMANSVVEQYIRSNMQRRYDAGNEARNFLQGQLAEMRISLERADQALQDFAQENRVANLDERQEMASQSLRDLNARLSDAQTRLLEYQSYREQIQSGRSIQLASVLENEAIRGLRMQMAELSTQRASMLQTFKEDYPAVVELNTRMSQIQTEIDELMRRELQVISSQYENLRAQAQTLEEAIVERENGILALSQQSVQYNILKREFETNRELYDGLLQRMKEIGLAAGIQENNISVIDPALAPGGPYHPNFMRSVLVALFLGAVIGIGLALLLEFLDTTVRRAEDFERLTSRPVLGLVPLARRDVGAVMAGMMVPLGRRRQRTTAGVAHYSVTHIRSTVSEAYRSLRTSLMFSTPEGMPKTLLITSPTPGAGKTTTAINLATVIAQNGARVLVIDADLRRPRLHVEFSSRQSPGLTNRIAGVGPDKDAEGNGKSTIIGTNVPGMFIMPSGSNAPSPPELLGSARMRELLRQSTKVFDHVIIDSPPILGLADSILLASMVDGVVMVVAAGQTTKDSIRNCIRRLDQVHANLLGVAMNQVDLSSPDYSDFRSDYYNYGTEDEDDVPETGIGARLKKA